MTIHLSLINAKVILRSSEAFSFRKYVEEGIIFQYPQLLKFLQKDKTSFKNSKDSLEQNWCRSFAKTSLDPSILTNIRGPKKIPDVQANHRKVSFNVTSEASNVYILSGQKVNKNAKNGPFWRVFENLKLAVKQCYQTGHF